MCQYFTLSKQPVEHINDSVNFIVNLEINEHIYVSSVTLCYQLLPFKKVKKFFFAHAMGHVQDLGSLTSD